MIKPHNFLFCLTAVIIHSIMSADCIICPPPQNPPYEVTVWFVNQANQQVGNGTYNNPYQYLTDALNASHQCDVIYVFPGTYDAGTEPRSPGSFVLQDNQRLLSTTLEAFQMCPVSCDVPTLINSSGNSNVVQLANNNEVSGFFITKDNGNGIAGGITPITNALITYNTFTVSSDNSNGVVFLSNPQLGNVIVSHCTFLGNDTSQDNGLTFVFCGNGQVVVSQNTFTGTDPTKGFQNGFIEQNSTADISFTLQYNNFTGAQNLSFSSAAIVFFNQGSVGAQNVKIVGNTIERPSTFSGAGIACINDTPSGPFYVALSNNTVITPDNSIPGYVIWNSNNGDYLLGFDNSNKGTLSVNSPNPAVPASPPYFPVFSTPLNPY